MRFLPVIVLLFLAGCTTVQPFSANSPEGRTEINSRTDDRIAIVEFHNGETVRTRSLRIEGDSLNWIVADPVRVEQAALSDVRAISYPTKRRYLLNSGIGFAIGAGIGLGLGVASLSDDSWAWGFVDRTALIVTVTGILGLTGATIGLIAALDQADRETYRVENSEE